MKKVPYIGQLTQTECGLCCVAMLLGYYGRHIKVSTLRSKYEIGRDGLKVSELVSALRENNMSASVYKASFHNIKEEMFPVIAFWENKHFVVIERISKDIVTVVDSALGRITLTQEEAAEKFSGIIISAKPAEGFEKNKKEKNVWFNYTYLLFNNFGLFIKVLILSLISYIFTLLTPMFVQNIVDSVVTNKKSFISGMSSSHVMILFMLVIGMYCFMTYLSGQRTLDYSKHIDKSINESLFSKLMKLPSKFFEIRSSGDILFRVQSLSLVRDMFAQKIVRFIMNIGAVLVILAYIGYLSTTLAMFCLLYFALSGAAIIYTRKKVLETNQSEIVEMSKLQSIQTEMIYSISNIKLTATEDTIYDKWKKQYNSAASKHYHTQKFQNIHTTFINMISTLGPIILFAVGMLEYKAGNMSLGSVIAVYTASSTYMGLCVNIFTSMDDFFLSGQYIDRVREISEEPVEEIPEDAVKCDTIGDIELDHVDFSYTNHSPKVIEDVSLKIKKGQKVAIVGPSGSGKTTLGKIILGLYKPVNGTVNYNGIDVMHIDNKNMRKQMGVVPQDMTLMNKTILENITLDRDDIDLDMVKTAASYARIDEEIEAMPMRYNTIISDLGTNISGGQKQRIAIARALVNNPKLLFLDEATSSLDTINEHIISSYVHNCGCTQIVIAHRISTIKDADIIFVMDKGRIIESGSHDELINKNGMYTSLYRNQQSDLKCA